MKQQKSNAPLAKFEVHVTDTYGGDANYSWVTKKQFEAPANIAQRALVKRAKQALGITCRTITEQIGGSADCLKLKFPGQCIVGFIDVIEWPAATN